MNTKGAIEYVDVIALCEAFNDARVWWQLGDGLLTFDVYRYAMDGVGYHVGYETFTGSLPLHRRDSLQLPGLPWGIFTYVVFPSQLAVKEIETPVDEEDYNRYLGDDNEGGYFAPDNEFAYSELEYVLEQAIKDMPETEFDGETRTWSCGYFVHKM